VERHLGWATVICRTGWLLNDQDSTIERRLPCVTSVYSHRCIPYDSPSNVHEQPYISKKCSNAACDWKRVVYRARLTTNFGGLERMNISEYKLFARVISKYGASLRSLWHSRRSSQLPHHTFATTGSREILDTEGCRCARREIVMITDGCESEDGQQDIFYRLAEKVTIYAKLPEPSTAVPVRDFDTCGEARAC
jgi:hypothetical protein